MIKHQLFTSDVDIESWLKFLNKSGVFDFVRVVCFALRQNIKEAYFMLSLVLTWSAFSEGVKVFGFPIMKPSFSFTNVKTITILAICSAVNNSGLLRTINAVLVRKKRFYASIALKSDLQVNTSVEFVHTRFQEFSDLVALQT